MKRTDLEVRIAQLEEHRTHWRNHSFRLRDALADVTAAKTLAEAKRIALAALDWDSEPEVAS